MPTLVLNEIQLAELITEDFPGPSHDDALPVINGPIDLKCVEIKVNVVDPNGLILKDYLCHITPHQLPGPLTLTKEVGTGVSFHIRNARETYYAMVWKAGASASTIKRLKFHPDADARDGIVNLTYTAEDDAAPLPPNVARGYVKAPTKFGGLWNRYYSSPTSQRRREMSEHCNNVFNANDKIAREYANSTQQGARTSRLLCFNNSDIGNFTMADVGGYWWRAWRYLEDGSRGEVIDHDIDVHYLLVEWEL